jgi:O-acetyl-ADP-ribose deacetylase (regulator of RNase III)
MIHYTNGDLLKSEAKALINTVNTVGVMGKGIALQFKKQFPENYRQYRTAYESGELAIGQLFITKERNIFGEKVIINFPTKKHWRNKSEYQYVSAGLKALRSFLIESDISSIAIPPLGCGNGGLDWAKVKVLIEEHLGQLTLDIFVYEP